MLSKSIEDCLGTQETEVHFSLFWTFSQPRFETTGVPNSLQNQSGFGYKDNFLSFVNKLTNHSTLKGDEVDPVTLTVNSFDNY